MNSHCYAMRINYATYWINERVFMLLCLRIQITFISLKKKQVQFDAFAENFRLEILGSYNSLWMIYEVYITDLQSI